MIEVTWASFVIMVRRGLGMHAENSPLSIHASDGLDFCSTGAILVEMCSVIPDGVVAFFTSYSYMESLISEWDAMGILRELTKSKLVFIETKDVVETTLALDNYRRACDCGRGAVFLSVARGKVRMKAFQLANALFPESN